MMYDEMMEKALDILKNDDDTFTACVDELDSWNGFADGFRCYEMCEIDDLHSGLSIGEFLDRLTGDFCKNDNYFYYSIYGLESTDDKAELYRNNVDEGDVLDAIIENYSNIDLAWIDGDFDDLINDIVEYSEDDDD